MYMSFYVPLSKCRIRLGHIGVEVGVDVGVDVDVDVDVMCKCKCILHMCMYMQLYVLRTTTQDIQVPFSLVVKMYALLYSTYGTLSTKCHKFLY